MVVAQVKCWQIRKGSKAPQAAGAIHGDFERCGTLSLCGPCPMNYGQADQSQSVKEDTLQELSLSLSLIRIMSGGDSLMLDCDHGLRLRMT